VLLRVLQNHPDRPLTHFPWVTRQFVHDPILSNDGVSSKPGAVQTSDKQIIDALKIFTDTRVIDALKVFIGGIGTYGPSSKKKFHSDILLLNLDKMIRERLANRPLFASIAELMMATFGIDWDQKKVRNRLKYLRRTGMDNMEYPSVESSSLPSPLDIPEPDNGVKTLS